MMRLETPTYGDQNHHRAGRIRLIKEVSCSPQERLSSLSCNGAGHQLCTWIQPSRYSSKPSGNLMPLSAVKVDNSTVDLFREANLHFLHQRVRCSRPIKLSIRGLPGLTRAYLNFRKDVYPIIHFKLRLPFSQSTVLSLSNNGIRHHGHIYGGYQRKEC